MNLYRIILVDDEEEVRKGIIRKIDWEALGFQVVGDAENGQDALEKIEQLEPDVVMTDIRMPYMDGLTLTSWIRQKYPSVKVLIFSGFDDFEYAQKAIKLNVTEYILKPVNVEELTRILNRVRENLDQEIEQRRDVDLLRESYLSSLPILRELFLNDMVRGNMPAENIRQKLEEYKTKNKPEADPEIADAVNTIKKYLESHYSEVITRKKIEELVHLNQDHINREFKKQTGYTLMEYVQHYRILMAKKMLRETTLSISEISIRTGYDSPAYFSKIFKKQTERTPLEYRAAKAKG